jgi:VirB8 protein
VRKGRAWRVAACLAALSVGACSGGSGDNKSAPKQSPCPLVARLERTAASVARADVKNPDAFDRTLQHAVTTYVATVRELREVTPADLQDDLERMEAAVNQYRFRDAADARPALDAYAAANCGPTATTGPSTGVATTARR